MVILEAVKIFIKKHNLFEFLDKSFIVQKILIPPKKSIGYKKGVQKLKRAGILTSLERIATYRLLIMIITFTTLIIGNIYYISIANQQTLLGTSTNNSSTFNFSNIGPSNASQNDLKTLIIKKTIELEPSYKKLLSHNQNQELVNAILKVEEDLNVKDKDGTLTKEIFTTFLTTSKINLKIMNIIMFLLVSFLMPSTINFYVMVITTIRQTKIEKEFKLMELITIILIKNGDITVEEILNVQRDYSKLLKEQYNKCLIEYPFDKKGAVENLIKSVGNEEFNTFMSLIKENLKGDRETNIKLLEAQKDLNYELEEEKYRGKINKYSLIFTILSFPVWILAALTLFIPVFKYISTSF